MNKFESLITSTDSALARRASNIAITAEIAQQEVVNSLKVEKAKLESDLMNLTDLAPNSKFSLRPGTKDWDPKTWAANLQNVKVKLHSTNIMLKLAEETYTEYFTELKKDK
jgi:hypothetical protein